MKKKNNSHNNVERTTFIFGLVAVVALLVYLGFYYKSSSALPPDLVVTATHQPKIGHNTYEIVVCNRGGETAEGVRIHLLLVGSNGQDQAASVDFNFIPVDSKRTAWATFYTKHHPADSLIIASATFVKP